MGRKLFYNKKPFSRHYVRLLLLLSLCFLLSLLAKFNWVFELFANFNFQYFLASFLLASCLFFTKRYGYASLASIIFIATSFNISGTIISPYIKTNLAFFLPNNIEDTPIEEIQKSGYVKTSFGVGESTNYISEEKPVSLHSEDISVIQYNVNKDNLNINEMARWILSQADTTDIVVLFEVTNNWQDAIDRIKWAFPYHIGHTMRGGRQAYIFSKLLIEELEVKETANNLPIIVVRGETLTKGLPFVVYAMHPPKPVLGSYANIRNEALMSAANLINKEERPYKLLIGDLNVTAYSPWFKKLQDISGLENSEKETGSLTSWPTYLPDMFGIPVDHLLKSSNINVKDKEKGPAMGSDHYPIVSYLELVEKNAN